MDIKRSLLNIKTSLLFWGAIVILPTAAAQRLMVEKEIVLPAKVIKVATGSQAIVYLADNKNQVWAYDSLGQQLAFYSPERLLTISQLIAKPGRQLVLFDKNNQTLTMLDRYLTERQTKNLQDWFPANYIEAVALADDNNWWLLDLNNQQLIKADGETGQKLSVISLNPIQQKNSIQVNGFWMHSNRLWLLSGNELLQFDRLGHYIFTLKLPVAGNYQPAGRRLYFTGDNLIGWLDTQTQEVKQIIYPGLHPNTLPIGDTNRLWLFLEDKLTYQRIYN